MLSFLSSKPPKFPAISDPTKPAYNVYRVSKKTNNRLLLKDGLTFKEAREYVKNSPFSPVSEDIYEKSNNGKVKNRMD